MFKVMKLKEDGLNHIPAVTSLKFQTKMLEETNKKLATDNESLGVTKQDMMYLLNESFPSDAFDKSNKEAAGKH